MKKFFVTIAIVLFCLWHIAAIGIWAQPTNFSGSPLLQRIESTSQYVRPYILLTSQWQHWDIFGQSTELAMTETNIEILKNDTWISVRIIGQYHPGLFRHSPENVSINHLENDGIEALQEPYLQDICRTEKLPAGTNVRIRKRFAFFPPHTGQQSVGWWKAWKPEWSEIILRVTSCRYS